MLQGKMQVEKAQENIQGSLDNTPLELKASELRFVRDFAVFMPAFLLAEIPLP